MNIDYIINEYELGSTEFRLANRLKAIETAIKLLYKKPENQPDITKLYTQGIKIITVLHFLNSTFSIEDWINQYSKYISKQVETTAQPVTQDQLDLLKKLFDKWGSNTFWLAGEDYNMSDVLNLINSGYLESLSDNRLGIIVYTITEKGIEEIE